MIQVWRHHELVAEFTDDHRLEFDHDPGEAHAGVVHVVAPDGARTTYSHGDGILWVGSPMNCVYDGRDDPNCPRCHPGGTT